MTTKKTFKNLVSFVLAVIMIFSMTSVAFATETDVAETGATKTVYVGVISYILNEKNFVPTLHYWNNSTGLIGDATLTAVGETKTYAVGSSYWSNAAQTFTIYKAEIDAASAGMKTYKKDSNDCWAAEEVNPGTNQIILVFEYGGTYHNQLASYTPTVTPTDPPATEPTEPTEPVDMTTICFRDDFNSVDTSDANVLVSFDGGSKTTMTKTVDTMSGHNMWYADVPENAKSVSFYRTNPVDDTVWNTWTAQMSGNTTGMYRATGWGTGSWGTSTHYFGIPDSKDIENLSFGIWADVKGNDNTYDCVIARQVSSGSFHLYLPSNTPESVTLYTSFASLSLGNATVNDGTAVKLSSDDASYTITYKQTSHDTSTKTGTLRVIRSANAATMLLHTKRQLYTGLTDGLSLSGYKDLDTKGSIYLYDEEGNLVNDGENETTLKKIKGRGNSSFEASMKVYGKYAYNFNLDEKVELIDGATKSKKWCLLANNVDHSMMRNTFIYALADELGVKYSPETRLVDVYDNGYYLGSYVITEKVEYGKSTLMSDMKNLDDGNEDANIDAYQNEDIMDDLEGHFVQKTDSYTVNGKTYSYQYTTSDDTTNWPYHQPEDYTSYNYLLEFELHNRYTNEASWFVSPRTGQPVVVKYPEFATQDEMKWIISEFEAVEAAIYANDTEAIKEVVDVDSFAKMYLIQELAINLDSCATSYYIHNDLASGKLVSSPVWDYDWALGAYAKDLKYIYNGSSVTTSSNMSDPKQMFVKNKAIQTDAGGRADGKSWIPNYNFQAKLVHNDYVWERCQYYWTNDMVDLLNDYVKNPKITGDTKGIIEDELLDKFAPSLNMNNARWSALTKNDTWGTKVTSDYVNDSFDFKVGNCGTSGNASKSYANTVYYLNDWIAERWNYMSSSTGGALYNEELKETVTAENATFVGVLNNGVLSITPAAEIIRNGEKVDQLNPELVTYEIYVNDKLVKTSTLDKVEEIALEGGIENSVYIVAYLTSAPKIKATSPVQKFSYGVVEYKVENVKFDGVQKDGTIAITPAAVVTKDGVELKAEEIEFTVYVNGTAVVTKTFADGTVEVTIPEGQYSEVYVKVNPVGVPTKAGTSEKQTFGFNVQVEKVEATLYFKSSSSARYAPKLTVGDTVVSMTKSGSAIGKNASQTQSYYWYTATVEIEKDAVTKLTFTNTYSMNASATVTLSEDTVKYYGVDNLNDGSAVVDLSDAEDYIKNFVKSASHMVYNDAHDAGVATTSIDGKIYKMGDADGDNVVSVMDSTQIQRALVGKTELSETNASLADFDLNSVNSIMDATGVQTFLTV